MYVHGIANADDQLKKVMLYVLFRSLFNESYSLVETEAKKLIFPSLLFTPMSLLFPTEHVKLSPCDTKTTHNYLKLNPP
jgi:hypothetical protein